jgi:uncharacterized OsmC-like protein
MSLSQLTRMAVAAPNTFTRSRLQKAALALAVLICANPGAIEGQAPRGESSSVSTPRVADDEVSSLNEYLVRKRAALFLSQNRPVDQAAPVTLRARVVAESRSGVRRLTIRNFQLLSDSQRSLAGYNLGAGSWETEVGVLASSVADEFLIHAAARGLPLDALDVVFTSQPDDPATEKTRETRVSYPRNLRYAAYIVSSATDDELEDLRRTVEQVSPVLNLVTGRQEIAHGKVFHTPSPSTPDPNAPPGLRDFLVEKRAALLRRQEEAKTNPPAPSGLRAHVRVEGSTGIRHIRVGDGTFQILHDSPRSLAGHDLGPTAEEHQLGVMGTCLTHIFEIQAALRQVTLDSLEIRVEGALTHRIGAGTTNPPRFQNVQYSVHIQSPASASEIDELRKAVEAVCPIYNLLKDPQVIEGRIVRTRYGTAS